MNKIVEKLSECIGKMNCDENKNEISSLEQKYGLSLDLLHQARQFLNITAKNFQDDLDLCEVNCQCW